LGRLGGVGGPASRRILASGLWGRHSGGSCIVSVPGRGRGKLHPALRSSCGSNQGICPIDLGGSGGLRLGVGRDADAPGRVAGRREAPCLFCRSSTC
jgi:hypothetical protein